MVYVCRGGIKWGSGEQGNTSLVDFCRSFRKHPKREVFY
jgi:hypothetical protein